MEFLLALVGGIFIFAIFAAIVWSFIFDAIVLLVSSIALHIDNKRAFFWNHIWMVWIMTGAASFCSMIILNFMTLGLLSTAIKVLISGGLSFLFNYYVAFRNDDHRIKTTMSIIFAIVNVLTFF